MVSDRVAACLFAHTQDCVSTHDRVMLKAVSCDHLSQVLHLVGDYSVIGVDEGQFFPDVR